MKRKVLWVEDGAFSDLTALAGALYMTGDYNLVVAANASDGFRYLLEKEFDAVIMDIRLPPGNDPYFERIYNSSQGSRTSARLGIAVLKRALKPSAENARAWIRPERFGVFTVENRIEVAGELDALGVKVYYQKTTRMPKDVLVEIVEEIMKASRQKRGAR